MIFTYVIVNQKNEWDSQQTFACSMSTLETLEKRVKYVQS